MQVISFMNMKGGVGKTTLAVNVAYGLAYIHKKKVLIVDCDPQFNATQYLLGEDAYLRHLNDGKKGTLRDIFVPKRPGRISTLDGFSRKVNKTKMSISECTCSVFTGGTGQGKLDLIPSTLNLMDVETSRRLTETKLKAYLEEKATAYDYVIIDCPPTISIFTQAAILASQKYIVPIKPDPLSVVGLPLLEKWLEDYTEDAGIKVKAVGFVFTLVRGPLPSRMRDVMEDLRKKRGKQVFDNYLSESTDVASSVEANQPIFKYKSGAKTSNQILSITQEFLNRTSGDKN